MTLYIDFHIIQTVPPSNINRDDTGSPKSAQYGGVRRSRVSSQAWKRAVRNEFALHLDTRELGVRTKRVVQQISDRIVAHRPDLQDSARDRAEKVLAAAGLKIVAPKTKKGQDPASLEALTEYLVFLSRSQIEALAELATVSEGESISKAEARNAFNDNHSIDVALFGRMLADAPDFNVDACCQVAHAISVHSVSNEYDYFTAVDDRAPADNAGAGMIGTVEFSSSTMYRYANVNVDKLIESLGSADAAGRAVEAFAKAFTLSMPTGKSNTFANRTKPDLLLCQVRNDQPVNLSGAFEDAITTTEGRTTAAVLALADYTTSQDTAYGTSPVASYYLAAGGAANPEARSRLATLGTSASLEEIAASLRQHALDYSEER